MWGRADALNPTNNLTPVDFRIRSPLEDDIRLGNVGARAFLRLSPVRLEGVWMPIYLATELPPVGLPPFVAFGPPRFPVAGPAQRPRRRARPPGAGGVRDVRLVPARLRAAARPDAERPDGSPRPTRPVFVSRTAYEQQVIGFDFSTALGEVATIRGEAAYRRPFDYQNRP